MNIYIYHVDRFFFFSIIIWDFFCVFEKKSDESEVMTFPLEPGVYLYEYNYIGIGILYILYCIVY